MRQKTNLGTLPARPAITPDDEDKDQHHAVLFQRFGPSGTIHQNLQRYRKRIGLKKKEVAALMEVTPRTYYAYETGNRPIPSPCIVRLAILTGGDLNEMLMGRPATPRAETIESAISDFTTVLHFLDSEYERMEFDTKVKIARIVVTTDWLGLPRIHPEVIRDVVIAVTRYRFHPDGLPAPPSYDDYNGDDKRFDEDTAAWQRMVDEDLSGNEPLK